MPENLRADFIEELVDRYIERYPLDEDGICHVPMVRLEVQGYKDTDPKMTERRKS